jgi:hypothetical protein
MASRISIADLSDATGIAPGLLEAEVQSIQRASWLGDAPKPSDEAPPPSSRRPPSRPGGGEPSQSPASAKAAA